MKIIAVCSCGQGFVSDDRAELARKITAHLKGDFFPAATQVLGTHSALIGEADTRLIIDVKTEPA